MTLKSWRKSGARISASSFQSYHLFPTLTAANSGDVSALQVCAEVNEQDLGRIRLGQAVLVRTGAFRGREFKGRVSIARVVG